MTTLLRQSSNPRLPRPDAYSHYVNRILPDKRPMPRRLLWWAVVLAMVGVGCLVAVSAN